MPRGKPFKPGQSGNPKGKPKGIRNSKNLAWDELGNYIVGKGAKRYLKIIEDMQDKEFTQRFETLLEFFKPKQQRTEIKGDVNIGPRKIGFEE